MNVIEVAKAINMHRQSVAKYLEMLVIAGHVDVKAFGPSKVYYISQRLPISAMLSLSTNFILVVDKDLRIINVNDRFLDFTKTKREEILNKSLEHFSFPIDFEPPIMPNVINALNGKDSNIEAYFKKRGNEQFFNIKFIPLVFDDGQPGATIMFEEVTDQRLIEMATRESEQKLRSVIEQSLDGIIITDEHGLIIEYNRGEEQITGISRENALGKYLWDFELSIEPEGKRGQDAQKKIKKIALDMLKSENSVYANKYYEVEIQRPDNVRRKVQVIKTPIQAEKGFMICGISRDVTDRKQMNEALEESEEKFRVLAETVSAGVAIYQGEHFVDVNKAFERLTGYSSEELLSMKFWDIGQEDYKLLIKERGLARQRGQAEPSLYECKLTTKSGEKKYVEFNAGYIIFKGKPGGVITCFDITERKQSEYALRESEANLRKAQQIAHFGSWKLYIDMKNISLSDELYRILGLEPAQAARDIQISFDKFLEYIRGEDRALFTVNMETAMRSQGGNSFDVRIIRKDGEERIVHVEQEVIFSDAGQPMLLYGICQDISERKRIEEEREELIRQLRESNEQLSMIMHVTENSATTQSVDEILNSTLNRLVRDMSADVCAVLLKENERVYVQTSQIEKLARARTSFPIGNGFESNIIGSVKPLCLDDAQLDSVTINPVLKEIGVSSVIGVPLRHRNDTIGVLYVEWFQPHVFKKQEQDVLQIIADRCGASIMMQSFMKRPKNFIEKTYINRNKYF
jgi:PAS domain S-box-containing protein